MPIFSFPSSILLLVMIEYDGINRTDFTEDKMAKLYFKYGAMGSSKTAQALITKFNYEERGMKVWLIKPALDDRDGAIIIKSRIGLAAECTPIKPENDILEMFALDEYHADVIIADECQFFTPENINPCSSGARRKSSRRLRRTTDG